MITMAINEIAIQPTVPNEIDRSWTVTDDFFWSSDGAD